MRHGPKFAGEVFFHQARLAAQPFDFARAINSRWFAARLFGKEYLLFFQFIKNRRIMRGKEKLRGFWVALFIVKPAEQFGNQQRVNVGVQFVDHGPAAVIQHELEEWKNLDKSSRSRRFQLKLN